MNYISKAAAVALLALPVFAAGCGQVHIGTLDRTRVQEEAPAIKAVVAEANEKLMEAQQEAQSKFEANPAMTPEEAQQLQMETQRKMAGLNQMYSIQLEQKMNVAVQDIVKEKKLDVVMDSSKTYPSVLMGGMDITDQVIQKLQ
ncbi:OmpH family outer membrane protein [Selenomonas sp. oral taxon 892]|jgi:hypothetical protein|uniref:OmpH family outer membrane protein n=1 Tax=Selenomonas sp. oral taxon 892 TaxID=1321785 RepID=UPI0003AD01E0|nr:OmpH family outer membrane protein [Selenomonas sp. oral taxon 892]ERJ95787.1 outer membrane protein [Selenomonas sp. oral taxon 892 str. F0426]